MRDVGFASAVLTHGIYVPWGIVGEVARQEGVHVVDLERGLSEAAVHLQPRRHVSPHADDGAARSLGANAELSPAQDRELTKYLASRREGLFDWIVFHRARQQDPQGHRHTDRPGPVEAGHRTADERHLGRAAALSGQRVSEHRSSGWCRRASTSRRDRDLQLLIRVHPAEISGFPPSRQPILEELRKRVPELAPNIIVVPPESDMSTYALMSLCNAAIIYGTKMGVELTSVGLPVIVAGEAWIRNKGLTHDASSPAEYFRILRMLPFRGAPGCGPARARPAVRLPLLLQPHDSAAVHRPEGGISDLPPQARPASAAAARSVGAAWTRSATAF